MAVGHGAHADQADFAFRQAALFDFFDQSRHRRRAVPADVVDNGLCFGAGLVIEKVDKNGCFTLPRQKQPAWRLSLIVRQVSYFRRAARAGYQDGIDVVSIHCGADGVVAAGVFAVGEAREKIVGHNAS